ncbi:MAG: DUF190 domain-containing protein [Marinilabiliaceae bacterium]|nr:DUF190 domain-containing protein [Marinilabiliaceae bacterium]
MHLKGKAKKLRIIVGENERVYQRPLYEAIVYAAKKYKLAGVTVAKGIMSYGADSMVHSVKVFSLAEDLPVIIEIVDVAGRIDDFASIMGKLMDKAMSGGLMYIEDVNVLRYSRTPL